jgi:hypothetical protein
MNLKKNHFQYATYYDHFTWVMTNIKHEQWIKSGTNCDAFARQCPSRKIFLNIFLLFSAYEWVMTNIKHEQWIKSGTNRDAFARQWP